MNANTFSKIIYVVKYTKLIIRLGSRYKLTYSLLKTAYVICGQNFVTKVFALDPLIVVFMRFLGTERTFSSTARGLFKQNICRQHVIVYMQFLFDLTRFSIKILSKTRPNTKWAT